MYILWWGVHNKGSLQDQTDQLSCSFYRRCESGCQAGPTRHRIRLGGTHLPLLLLDSHPHRLLSINKATKSQPLLLLLLHLLFQLLLYVQPGKQVELPYAFDALEPHIDTRTVMLHYGRHYSALVNGTNNAVRQAGGGPAEQEPHK